MTRPATGSHGNVGAEALAAGNGVEYTITTEPAPEFTAAASTAPKGP
jgi:hypothetical protein